AHPLLPGIAPNLAKGLRTQSIARDDVARQYDQSMERHFAGAANDARKRGLMRLAAVTRKVHLRFETQCRESRRHRESPVRARTGQNRLRRNRAIRAQL